MVGSIASETRTRKTSADTIPKATMPPTPLVLADEHPSTTNVTPLEYRNSETKRRDGGSARIRQGRRGRSNRPGGRRRSNQHRGRRLPTAVLGPGSLPTRSPVAHDADDDACGSGDGSGPKRGLRGWRIRGRACAHARDATHRPVGSRSKVAFAGRVYTRQGALFVTSNLAGRATWRVPRDEARDQNRSGSTWRSPSCRGSRVSSEIARRPRPRGAARAVPANRRTGPREAARPVHLGIRHCDLLRRRGPAEQRLPADASTRGDLETRGIQRRIAVGFESQLILERGQDHVVQAERIDTAIATAALPDDVRAALLLCKAPHTIEEVAQFVVEQPGSTDPQRGYRVAAMLLSLGAVHWT